MELNEASEILNAMTTRLSEYLIGYVEVEALQTAISHLETLQRVKEMGGVKKRDTIGLCYCHYSNNTIVQCDYCKNRIFNEVLDLKEAELAGKLEGLEGFLWTRFPDLQELTKPVANKIQELILGKKEE